MEDREFDRLGLAQETTENEMRETSYFKQQTDDEHAGDGFIVGGSCSRADSWLGSALLVAKSGGKEVSHIEKNNDL